MKVPCCVLYTNYTSDLALQMHCNIKYMFESNEDPETPGQGDLFKIIYMYTQTTNYMTKL